MMRFLLVIILVFPTLLSAQVHVKIHLSDEQGDPVRNAKVVLNEIGAERKAMTAENGNAFIDWYRQYPTVLSITHPGFQEYNYELSKKDARRISEDTLPLRLVLNIRELRPVIVSPIVKPDTVFGSKEVSVSDYEFTDTGFIYLTYDQTLRKGAKLLSVDQRGKIRHSHDVPGVARRLFRDYRGRIFVICDEEVFLVRILVTHISLQLVDQELFYTQLFPVIDTFQNGIFFSNYSPDYPSFGYYRFNSVDSTVVRFCTITDADMMELYRAEYKYAPGAEKLWAYKQELKTGIDKEIWIGAKYFTSSIYYEPVYAPMFLIRDTLHVFDHYQDILRRYNPEGAFIDSLAIFHHKVKKPYSWEKKLIKDAATGEVYSICMEGGYHVLFSIDMKTGEISGRQKLYFKYAENIRVQNGLIYYIYRPFESSQKKFLYSERVDLQKI